MFIMRMPVFAVPDLGLGSGFTAVDGVDVDSRRQRSSSGSVCVFRVMT
jgi:hypothetical protein